MSFSVLWGLFAGFAVILADRFDTRTCRIHLVSSDVIASCNGLNLASVPTSIPQDVTILDLSHNMLTEINGSDFRRFKTLRVLDLSFNMISLADFELLDNLEILNLTHNNITNVCKTDTAGNLHEDWENGNSFQTTNDNTGFQSTKKKHATMENKKSVAEQKPTTQTKTLSPAVRVSFLRSLQTLHLDHNLITFIQAGCFVFLRSLEVLSLSGNRLQTIPNDTFRGLFSLQELRLDNTKLQTMDPGSLNGLSQLQTLFLSFNKLTSTEFSIPLGLFRPVGLTLRTLYLHGNDLDGSYPDAALSDLVALETLTIDTFASYDESGAVFGSGFGAMKKLRTLDLSYNFNLNRITNQTFLPFANSSLQTLLMPSSFGKIFALENCAFCPLKHLSILRISDAKSMAINIDKALQSFYAFQLNGNELALVDLNVFVSYNVLNGMVTLTRRSTEFLLKSCVRTLLLRSDNIVAIERHAFGGNRDIFNSCLRRIDLSHNRIAVFDILSAVSMVMNMPSLVSLEIQQQNVFSLNEAMYMLGNNKDPSPVSHPGIANWTLPLSLNSHFSFLNLSSACNFFGYLPQNLILKNCNLRVLDFSYVTMIGCTSKIMGLEHLENLNMSGNNCRHTDPSFLDSLPALRILTLQTMNFDPTFMMNHGTRLLQNVTKLERLDLSLNGLERLPFDFVHKQGHLSQLLLANNKLQTLSLDFSRHGNLTLVDISDNQISQLTATERESLDQLIARQSHHFHLRLHGNPLACTCRTLDFVLWLRSTSVQLDNHGDFPCRTDNGDLTSTGRVADQWQLAWRRCVGPTALWASVAGMLLLLSLVGAVWGVAANATRLRFLLRVFKHIKMPRRAEFEKDAYIAYCDADAELVCFRLKPALQDRRGVRLLIKDLPRDELGLDFYLLPGDNVAQKMLEHIDLCWKVVLVLTPAQGNDPMAGFTTRAVLQSISDKMPDRVLLVCVGVRHVPALASVRALLDTVPENQVFFVPDRAGEDHPAWDDMAAVIMG
ncbi:toll-like receptor 3 [Littorina saxatilis]|uniref:TIR domain-containing protein n=1 Tax=Littorina saxatilis TaxID=31220 RepID=A0AAN9C260_9CAEN